MSTSRNESLGSVAKDLVKQLLGLMDGCNCVSRPIT